MNERKENNKLTKKKMKDVKAGIPYEKPGLIDLKEISMRGDCQSGNYNVGGNCSKGKYNKPEPE